MENNSSGNEEQNSAIRSIETKPTPELEADPSFTPGPWEVQQLPHISGDLWLQIGWKDKYGDSWGPIAELKYLVASDAQQWADARLIAAAPALYEAATAILNSTDYCDDQRPLMNSLRAALTLAGK